MRGGLIVLAAALALGACGGAASNEVTLLNVSYDPTRELYEEFNAAFSANYKTPDGKTVKISMSHGGSGKQARTVIDGIDAQVVTLALQNDIDVIARESGKIPADWRTRLPGNASPYTSTIVFLVRAGNPKGIKDWDDLAKAGVSVITPNPKTSGGARWNFLGLWGSVTQTGGSEAQARAFVTSVYRNVENLPKDAREATDAFLKRGQGDVLLNYENEAILARSLGELKQPFVVPEVNILIEGPVAVVDRNVDSRGTRKPAEALAAYLQSAEAQRIFAEQGFRPVNAQVWQEVKSRFASVPKPFTVAAFGGWQKVESTFFAKSGGLWDELFGQSRR